MKQNVKRAWRALAWVELKTGRTFRTAPDYSEPGHTLPPGSAGIVLGNWNPTCGYSVSKEEQKRDPITRLTRILERAKVETEWEDEWELCSDCGRAVRIVEDSFWWQPSFTVHEGNILCASCAAL